ncbi:MAG: hypothetical protein V8R16_06150 [Bacilli bacterium]
MKPIILSDQSTNLNNENIFIVTNEKSSLGQIAYSLDLISNGGKDIIYLSSHELFDKISKLANNIVSMHNKNNAIVIDIDSSIISKEELVNEIINSKNVLDTVITKQCKYSFVKMEDLEIANNKALYTY